METRELAEMGVEADPREIQEEMRTAFGEAGPDPEFEAWVEQECIKARLEKMEEGMFNG